MRLAGRVSSENVRTWANTLKIWIQCFRLKRSECVIIGSIEPFVCIRQHAFRILVRTRFHMVKDTIRMYNNFSIAATSPVDATWWISTITAECASPGEHVWPIWLISMVELHCGKASWRWSLICARVSLGYACWGIVGVCSMYAMGNAHWYSLRYTRWGVYSNMPEHAWRICEHGADCTLSDRICTTCKPCPVDSRSRFVLKGQRVLNRNWRINI